MTIRPLILRGNVRNGMRRKVPFSHVVSGGLEDMCNLGVVGFVFMWLVFTDRWACLTTCDKNPIHNKDKWPDDADLGQCTKSGSDN